MIMVVIVQFGIVVGYERASDEMQRLLVDEMMARDERDNWLSNHVFTSDNDIFGHCCDAWTKLVGQTWKLMSIGRRDWAHGF